MNIKKLAASFVAAAMTACSLVTGSLAADIGVADGTLDEATGLLYVEKEDGTLRVTYPDRAEPKGDVVIPETFGDKTVTEMSGELIYSVAGVTSVSIPKTVTVIGDSHLFIHRSEMKSITVADDNPSYSSEDGVLFNKDKTELLKYPASKEGTSYDVPSTVTEIFRFGFTGSKIGSIQLPTGLETLGEFAFANCDNLKEISLPGSLKQIGYGPISNSGVSSVKLDQSNTNFCIVDNVLFTANKETLIAYPPALTSEKYTVPEGTKTLVIEAFSCNKNLQEVVLPDSVSEIGRAFSFMNNLKSIKIPEGVRTIPNQCFMACGALETVDIPVTVTEIWDEAFISCDALKTINYGGTQADWDKIVIESGNEALNKATIKFSDSTTGGTDLSDVVQEPARIESEDGKTVDFTPGVKKNITTSDNDIETMKKVKATAPKEAFEEDVMLNVSHDTFSPDKDSFAVDISFVNDEGTKVQPKEGTKVTVKIPVPENLKDKESIFVYHVNAEGKAEKVEAKTEIIDEVKYMVFEASSFSTYVLSEKSNLAADDDTTQEKPETPTTPTDTGSGTVGEITSGETTSSETSNSETTSSETASSETTSSETTSSEPVSTDSGNSDTSSNSNASNSADGNPVTGAAFSFIPIIAAVSAVLVLKRRK